MPTFDTPQPISAVVEIAAGSVRLVATDRGDTVVDVRPRDESRPHDVRAAEQVRVDLNNGTLTVTSRRGFSFPRRGAVIVDVALPSGSRLHASSASADVIADGEYADCKFASASGDFTVGDVAGNLKADTASGAISVRVVKGSASVATASGDAVFGELAGDVKFQAASGSLSVARLGGNLNAQTASGDVIVAAAVRGNISVQTSSGEVGVGIAEGTAAQLDLRTGSGSIRNSLQPSDGPAEGDETLVVHARTGSGDVIVRRATGPMAA
jgi:Putative adhesin